MISIFITILVLLLVNFGNGVVIKNILNTKYESFVFTSFIGIIGITLFSIIFAFFFPLGLWLEIVFMMTGSIGLVSFLLKQKVFRLNQKLNFWFYFLVAVIVFVGSFAPYLYDHYSYYIPTISYLKEFGFVKGISSLDLLLGQSSFWHIYQAVFSHFIDSFFKINTYLLVLFLIYIYERKQFFLLIFIPFFLIFVQQPNTDLPISIICLIVINELIFKRDNPLLLYLAMFAFCIKPIIFWLPLFVILLEIIQKKFSFKSVIPVFAFGILMTMKNLWLYGFPIFPVSFIDFNLPWKPSKEILTYSSQFGLLKSYDMKYSYQLVSGFDFFDKIYYWFLIGYKSFLNIGIITSLLIVTIFAFKKKKKLYYLLLICLSLKLILIFLFSAQYRFFIDFYLVALFLVFKNLSGAKAVLASVVFSTAIAIGFSFPVLIQNFGLGKKMSGFFWSQLYKPKENIYVNTNSEYKIGNLNFYVPKYPFQREFFPSLNVYDLRLYDYYGVFPQYFGEDAKSGFFQRKLTNDEKILLKKILSETEKNHPKVL